MPNAIPVVSDEGTRLIEMLEEALQLADQLEWHFAAAKIDHVLRICQGAQGQEIDLGGD